MPDSGMFVDKRLLAHSLIRIIRTFVDQPEKKVDKKQTKTMTNVTRTYALTMTKPHEALGLEHPLVRQIAKDPSLARFTMIWALLFCLGLTYIGLITASSAQSFQLRDAQDRVDRLTMESRALETMVARTSSIDALSKHAANGGYVQVATVQTIDAAGHSYAFAR
jgi:hypothetical protein